MVVDSNFVETKKQNISVLDNSSVRLLVLARKNFSFDGKTLVCNMNCCGKTIKEWAVSSAGDFPCVVVEYGLSDNIVDIVKPHLRRERVTVVLYAETPLIRHNTIVNLVNDFLYKKQKVRKFKRGYIFDTDYIRYAENIYAPEIGVEDSEDFLPITNIFDYTKISQIMKNRIMNYHIANGVQFIDVASTYIEAEVELQSGVVVYPNNNLLGKTFVESGVVLYPNNTIKDSYICEKSVIKSAYIESAKVQAGTIVEPFTCILPKTEDEPKLLKPQNSPALNVDVF